jgi:hypothetical protein
MIIQNIGQIARLGISKDIMLQKNGRSACRLEEQLEKLGIQNYQQVYVWTTRNNPNYVLR